MKPLPVVMITGGVLLLAGCSGSTTSNPITTPNEVITQLADASVPCDDPDSQVEKLTADDIDAQIPSSVGEELKNRFRELDGETATRVVCSVEGDKAYVVNVGKPTMLLLELFCYTVQGQLDGLEARLDSGGASDEELQTLETIRDYQFVIGDDLMASPLSSDESFPPWPARVQSGDVAGALDARVVSFEDQCGFQLPSA